MNLTFPVREAAPNLTKPHEPSVPRPKPKSRSGPTCHGPNPSDRVAATPSPFQLWLTNLTLTPTQPSGVQLFLYKCYYYYYYFLSEFSQFFHLLTNPVLLPLLLRETHRARDPCIKRHTPPPPPASPPPSSASDPSPLPLPPPRRRDSSPSGPARTRGRRAARGLRRRLVRRASSSPVVGCGACRAQIGAVAPAVERVHRRMAATAGEPP